MVFQMALALVMPGYMQEGLPVPSLNYKTLMYKCNALSSFYATLVVCAGLHLSGLYRLTQIIEHFGEYMTVSMIAGFAVSFATYFHAVLTNSAHRMSGNFAYDLFMGAALNPRIGIVDLKMWAEVRIPWVLLFLISVSGACQQYEVYGYVTPNMAFMVLCTGLYINACAKGEECIPQTWVSVLASEKIGIPVCLLIGTPFICRTCFMKSGDSWSSFGILPEFLSPTATASSTWPLTHLTTIDSVHQLTLPCTRSSFLSIGSLIRPWLKSLDSECNFKVLSRFVILFHNGLGQL